MKQLLYFFFFLGILPALFAQNPLQGEARESYRKFVEPGFEALKNEDYKKCSECFENAFKLSQHSFYSMTTAAECYTKADKPKKAVQWLSKALDLNYEMTSDWITEERFDALRNKKRCWKKLNKKIEASRIVYEKDINVPLRDELKKMSKEDQKYRSEMQEVSDKYGWESPEMKALWDKQNTIDAANIIRIEEIIAEYGYPGKKLVGANTASAAFLVIQHADLKYQEKYLPLLQEAADKGDLRKASLALLIDRVLMRNGKKQRYGSQVGTDEETDKQLFFEIEDPDNVDMRRAEMGLGPIGEYGKNWDIKWPSRMIKPKSEKAPSPKEMIKLLAGTWTLKAIKYYPQEEIILPTKDYTISFAKEKFRFTKEVNKCSTSYTLLDDFKIEIKNGGGCTKKCCDKDISDQLNYHDVTSYEVNGNKLLLISANKKFEFIRAGK